MSKPRNTNLPQHHYDQGHYGELPLLSLPSGSHTGEAFTYNSGSQQQWNVGFPILIQEDGTSEGRVYILDFQGPGVDVQMPATGQARITIASGSQGLPGAVNFLIGDGSTVITTGQKGYIRWPFGGLLTRASLLSTISGSIVVDVWKDTYGNFPPNSGDSITAAAKPTLASQNKSEDTTLTGWTKTFGEGDVYGFNVESSATITLVTLELKYQRT